MRYMIDTRTISKERPSPQQVKMNRWKLDELNIMGLTVPYDSSGHIGTSIPLTQFKSQKEYRLAMIQAMQLLDDYKQVPEPLRTKLIKEADNLRAHGKESCLI